MKMPSEVVNIEAMRLLKKHVIDRLTIATPDGILAARIAFSMSDELRLSGWKYDEKDDSWVRSDGRLYEPRTEVR